jgi:hypothetical protein
MGSIRHWADTTEESLWQKAGLAKLFSHPGLVGEQRETQLIRVLADFLPTSVAVGRGQLIDCRSERSAQMDVVVARGDVVRLPLADSGSTAYLAESVLAVMEVKSLLDKTTLVNAIRTLASAGALTFLVNVPDPRSDEGKKKGAMLTEADVKPIQEMADLVAPCSYIYGYAPKTKAFLDGFADSMRAAVMETQLRPNLLPSVIACRGVVAIRNDEVLFPSNIFGGPWLYAMREESHPLYWVLAHLVRRLIMVAGQPGVACAPASYILDSHLDEPPTDWKLLKVQMAKP